MFISPPSITNKFIVWKKKYHVKPLIFYPVKNLSSQLTHRELILKLTESSFWEHLVSSQWTLKMSSHAELAVRFPWVCILHCELAVSLLWAICQVIRMNSPWGGSSEPTQGQIIHYTRPISYNNAKNNYEHKTLWLTSICGQYLRGNKFNVAITLCVTVAGKLMKSVNFVNPCSVNEFVKFVKDNPLIFLSKHWH